MFEWVLHTPLFAEECWLESMEMKRSIGTKWVKIYVSLFFSASKVISNKKDELIEILDQFNIQVSGNVMNEIKLTLMLTF